MIVLYAKCYIITKESVSSNLFTLKSDKSFSHKLNSIFYVFHIDFRR